MLRVANPNNAGPGSAWYRPGPGAGLSLWGQGQEPPGHGALPLPARAAGAEAGIEGVLVILYGPDGNIMASDTTDVNGMYLFTGLAEGNYYCGFGSLPITYLNFVASPHVLATSQEAVNSDITEFIGTNIISVI